MPLLYGRINFVNNKAIGIHLQVRMAIILVWSGRSLKKWKGVELLAIPREILAHIHKEQCTLFLQWNLQINIFRDVIYQK